MKPKPTLPMAAAGWLLIFSAAAAAAEHSATIVRVGDTYGNLDTDLDAAQLGLSAGDGFSLTCRDSAFDATWAVWYSDAPEGGWLGLANEAGNVQIAINNGDADATTGCTVGDVLTIRVP